jgi:hypothetical protein
MLTGNIVPPTSVGQLDFLPLEFNENGGVVRKPELDAIVARVKLPEGDPGRISDLYVISHGWNNNHSEAISLYTNIFGRLRNAIAHANPVSDKMKTRPAAVLGVFWPSKKWDDDELTTDGVAVAADDTASVNMLLDRLAAIAGETIDANGNAARHPDVDAVVARAKHLVPSLAGNSDAREEFVRIVRSFMPQDANAEEPAIDDDLHTLEGDDLLRRLGRRRAGEPAPAVNVDEGGVAGIGDFLSSAVKGAKNLLNLVTYYQMKNRAGIVGARGLNDVLRQIRAVRPATGPNALNIHLIGHSFGGRLVAAAAAGQENSAAVPINSISLLQAAFSHFGFAEKYDGTHDGFFRRVVVDPARVQGPIIITHTEKDKAVGLAYPLASRIARQIAAAVGDKNDPYGGIGRNGAQKSGAQQVTMQQLGGAYSFVPHAVYNIDANQIIMGHSDLDHDGVGYAIMCAAATS